MPKVVYAVGISLDGYIERPDGAVDFLFMPKDYSMAPFLASVDAAFMGRKTFDVAPQSMGEATPAAWPTANGTESGSPGRLPPRWSVKSARAPERISG